MILSDITREVTHMAGINATKTETIENEYRNGVDKTVSLYGRVVTVFIGTIDYTKYPYANNTNPNYNQIVWTDSFSVQMMNKIEDGLSFEVALQKFFDCKDSYKVLRQKRILVDGTEDEIVIRYV